MFILRRAPRSTALLIGILPLVLVELFCRAAGLADHRDRPDPFAGFSPIQPSFERTTGADRRPVYVARERAAEARRFLAEKPENGFRVFVFGGSSEAGTPYGYDYSFAHFLKVLLAGALPDRVVEVVNCAVPGYASRRLLYLASEMSAYEPDLYIISMGHNELVEQRLYAHLFDRPIWVFKLGQWLRQFRIYVLLGDVVRLIRSHATEEFEVREIYVPVFGAFAAEYWKDEDRDPTEQRHYALSMFETNLDRMILVAERAGAKTLIMSQSKNYADWPVTVSEHRRNLSPEDLRSWEELVARAASREQTGDLEGAILDLERALAIDPEYAKTYQRLAEIHRRRGEFDAARELYVSAHNITMANFGTTPRRNEAARELAEERGSLWLDIERVFEEASPNGLVGFNLFVDFLHPNLAGHQLIAHSIFETLKAAHLPVDAADWKPRPSLPSPASLLANPSLRAAELKSRVVAELAWDRWDTASELMDQLRRIAPEDPDLPRLERWLAGDLPFDRDTTDGR